MIIFRSIISIIIIFASLSVWGQANDKIYYKNMTKKNYFDNRGQVFIKLYKKQDSTYLYWEIWNTDDKNAIAHWGQLGNFGDKENVNGLMTSDFKISVNSLINTKISEGYKEISLKNQFTVAVSFLLKTWGTPKDLDRREQMRNILNEHLGWTGNGRCDDGDIGGGEMTLYADVVDPFIAVKTISKELRRKKVEEEYYFTITQGDKMIAEKILPSKE